MIENTLTKIVTFHSTINQHKFVTCYAPLMPKYVYVCWYEHICVYQKCGCTASFCLSWYLNMYTIFVLSKMVFAPGRSFRFFSLINNVQTLHFITISLKIELVWFKYISKRLHLLFIFLLCGFSPNLSNNSTCLQ